MAKLRDFLWKIKKVKSREFPIKIPQHDHISFGEGEYRSLWVFQNGTPVRFVVWVRGSVEADEYLIRLTVRHSQHSKHTNLQAVGSNGIIQRNEGRRLRKKQPVSLIHYKSQPGARRSRPELSLMSLSIYTKRIHVLFCRNLSPTSYKVQTYP